MKITLSNQVMLRTRSSRQEVFCKKDVRRNFAKLLGNHLCQSLFFNKVACNFIKRETLAQVFSCEFCEISKNTYSYRTPPVATSEKLLGVTIDLNLNFKELILSLCKKTNRKRPALSRVFKYMTLNKHRLLMKSFI